MKKIVFFIILITTILVNSQNCKTIIFEQTENNKFLRLRIEDSTYEFKVSKIISDFGDTSVYIQSGYSNGNYNIKKNKIKGVISNKNFEYSIESKSIDSLKICKGDSIKSKSEGGSCIFDTAGFRKKITKKLESKNDETETTTSSNHTHVANLRLDSPPVGCYIRVLVAYTQNAINRIGTSNLQSFIDGCINTTNQSYINSNMNVRLKLARSIFVDYDENSDGKDVSDNLEHFSDEDDGVMDNIVDEAEKYKADVKVLILQKSSKDSGGEAYTIDADDADEAYCVVQASVANAFGWYSFAHEIGHLQGAMHNIEDSGCGILGPICYAYNLFAYGYRFLGNDNLRHRTIMAYPDNDLYKNVYRILFWSNPHITDSSGSGSVRIGTIVANNALKLNNTFNHMASLMDNYTDYSSTDLNISNHGMGNFSATNNINLSSNVTVKDGSQLTLFAGNNIRLQSGFRVQSGSSFRARVGSFTECGNSNGRLESKEVLDKKKYIFSVSPNPTTSKVHLTTGFDGESEIVLTDIAGKTLQTFTTTSNETDIDLSAYSNGMYFFKITNRLGKHIAKVMLSKE